MSTKLSSINPANELPIGTWPVFDATSIDGVLDRAYTLASRWSQSPRSERLALLLRVAEQLEQHVDQLAQGITEEMGKPIREARAEVKKCALVCRHYAATADAALQERRIEGVGYVRIDPLGPILAIMPWNFPFWQVFRVAVPAIALGNPIVLKHAENVCSCALACEALFRAAGAPEGAFQTIFTTTAQIPSIIHDTRIAGVTLTGSERAGSAVGALAGSSIKPVVLELGGSDPFVVLADADLARAVEVAVQARMQNSGQSCIAAKRFIIEAPIYDRFVRLFSARVQELSCDDPAFESTQVGPLARADLLEHLEEQVRESVGYGARVVCGGSRRSGRGYFYEPTVLAEVTERHRVFSEEVFGPVASMLVADDEAHAISLANQTPFGLGASIWTQPERGLALAPSVRAGCVGVNQMVRSDPRTPFGGVGRSGVGRELGTEGLLSFANVRTVITEG